MAKALSITMLVASAFCLAAGIVLAKAYVSGIDPVAFLAVQLGASVLFLWTILFLQGAPGIERKTVAAVIRLGLLIGLAAICTIYALRLTTASQASLIFATQPVLIAALAWPLLDERPTGLQIGLALLALLGVAAVAHAGTTLDAASFGNLLALLSTAFAAYYVVRMRKLTVVGSPLASLAILQTVAFGVALLVLLLRPKVELAISASFGWSAVSGILQYGLGYWLYLIGLKETKAAVAGLYLNLVPLFTVSLAFLFLGEILSVSQWFGGIVILAAVVGISLFEIFGPRPSAMAKRG